MKIFYPAIRTRRMISAFCWLAAAGLLLVTCQKETVPKPYLPTASHTEYSRKITALHLEQKALGARWLAAAAQVWQAAIPVAIPFREERFFSATEPAALSLEFTIPRGLRLKIAIEAQFTAYFLDLFRIDETKAQRDYVAVATKPQDSTSLEITPRVQGRYLVRIQPELLEEGSMLITITGQPSLDWPVKGSTEKDVISYFGLNRDAGERVHHGLDIKAPRGREVVAALRSSGSPGETNRGCHVVRLRDNILDVMLYYAHLDTQLIGRGTPLEPGDAVGTVGTTGNARGGTPHLHFGIYDGSWRTPVDPWYFLFQPDNTLGALPELPRLAGGWLQVVKPAALLPYPAARSGLHKSPASRDFEGNPLDPQFTASFHVREPAGENAVLQPGTPVQLLGRRSGYLLVASPAGNRGYLAAANTGSLQPRAAVLSRAAGVTRSPAASAPVVAQLAAATPVALLGRYADRALLRYRDVLYWAEASAIVQVN